MKGARHWFNQHSGLWPYAACGFEIDDELGDDYTLWMSRVGCPTCRVSVQSTIELLVIHELPDPPASGQRANQIRGHLDASSSPSSCWGYLGAPGATPCLQSGSNSLEGRDLGDAPMPPRAL